MVKIWVIHNTMSMCDSAQAQSYLQDKANHKALSH